MEQFGRNKCGSLKVSCVVVVLFVMQAIPLATGFSQGKSGSGVKALARNLYFR